MEKAKPSETCMTIYQSTRHRQKTCTFNLFLTFLLPRFLIFSGKKNAEVAKGVFVNSYEQATQRTYNVILRRVRVTIVTVEKQ